MSDSPIRAARFKGWLQVYDGHFIASAGELDGAITAYLPDYSNDYLANIPEIVEVEIIVREKRSLGKPVCLNGPEGGGS